MLGEIKLRPKSEGVGVMVSAFQSEIDGFGIQLSAEKLAEINVKRVAAHKVPLESSPGVRFLDYGKNKEGYWDAAMMETQVSDIMDVFEHLYPNHQLLLKIDWSSGHSKMKEDGLHADNMNAKYGGKQSKLRPSVLTEGCVGTAPAVAKWVEHGVQTVRDMRLKVGDTQVFVFQPSDPPPFNCPTAPRHDTHNTAKPNKLVTPRKKKGQAQPEPAQTVPNIIEGYVGKAKGTAQILWERGLYDARMKLDAPTIIKDAVGHVVTIPSMRQVLSACPDFLNEKTSMQELVESRGHILCMTPKYHPELAGVGIEFSWGRAKYMFRKEINDFKATNLKANVMRALSTQGDGAVLPLALVRRYARRARDYLRAYAANPGPKEFKMIEKMKQHQKTHRSIFDLEFAFLGSA